MKTWNDRLKSIFEENKALRQSDMARAIGVSAATVSDWINGHIKTIEGENLLNVCEYLKISPAWLQFGKGDKVYFYSTLSRDDIHAMNISRMLGSKERRAWYRAGDTLSEPDEGTNGEE